MTKLKPGDCVNCLIQFNTIVGPYNTDYDEVRTFEIVSRDETGYYLYVPSYTYIKESIKADQYLCRKLSIDKKFIDVQIIYIQEGMIHKIKSILDGCVCTICLEFYSYAVPNQEDGSLICWSCRSNIYR